METLRVYRTPILTLDPDAKADGGMVEVVKYADAQATIAALEEAILKMGENAAVVAKDAMAAKEQVAALQARVKELEEITKVICGHCCEPMEIPSKAVLQSQLTQRTAELEAAKAQWTKTNAEYERVSKVHSKLQAELERVRGERTRDVSECVRLTNELERLNKLILALPKVEGEINERFCTGSYYSSPHDYRSHVTFETALVALLKHRQGMEGV